MSNGPTPVYSSPNPKLSSAARRTTSTADTTRRTERKTVSSSSRRLAGDRGGNQAPAPNASRASNRSVAGRRSKLALTDGKNAEFNSSPGQFKPHASSTARSERFTTPFFPTVRGSAKHSAPGRRSTAGRRGTTGRYSEIIRQRDNRLEPWRVDFLPQSKPLSGRTCPNDPTRRQVAAAGRRSGHAIRFSASARFAPDVTNLFNDNATAFEIIRFRHRRIQSKHPQQSL